MTSKTAKKASRLLLLTACLAAVAAGQNITQQEREQALRYLSESRSGVVDAVKGLSEAQWKFKPAPDRWSVAEVVEHLALIEDILTQNILGNIEKAPAPSADRDAKQVDATVVAKVLDRSTKFQAPPQAIPSGRWAPSEALQLFLSGRTQTVALLKGTPDLRQHSIDHPVFGPLDGYEWVLAVAAHSARHTKQILEVKADPNFPAN
jgi:hypothetical protein